MCTNEEISRKQTLNVRKIALKYIFYTKWESRVGILLRIIFKTQSEGSDDNLFCRLHTCPGILPLSPICAIFAHASR